ncbi:hypothetical protein ACHAXM_010154 [Skeletonema potamos]|jgi:hypothetical protein
MRSQATLEIMDRKRKRDVMPASASSPSHGYEIVTINKWLHGWSSKISSTTKANDILPLVDLRSYDEFNKTHLHTDDATPLIVNLPLETLISGERSCELPPRHVEFAILVPISCTELFSSRNSQCSIHNLFFASKSSATQQSRKPWLVRQVILESEDLWNEERVLLNYIQMKRNTDVSCESKGSVISFRPLPRLWKPDPLVSSGILPLLKDWIRKQCNTSSRKDNNHQHTPWTVFDLGSGAGRDVCYLAEEVKAFYHSSMLQQQSNEQNKHFPLHFVGVDHHRGSAKRCEPLWRNRGIGDITSSHLLNLNKMDLVNDCFMNTSFINQTTTNEKSKSKPLCIYAIRFLNRKLLSHIASSTSSIESMDHEPSSLYLPIGTIMAISHFCKPTKTADWSFDHPKVSNVLERDELNTLFGNKTDGEKWSILMDDICSDGDHGRTLIQFIARKIA